MPISYKDFKEGNFKKRADSGDFVNHPVYIFLKKNATKKDCCFTVKEIKEIGKMKITVWGIRQALRKMRKKKLIQYKSPFYTAKK